MLRKDVDPSSYGTCQTEEIRGAPASEDDILLIAKAFMSDPEPYKVKVLLTAADASTFRKSFVQPSGVAARRPIVAKVKTNVHSKVPPLVSQGFLSDDAAAYLTNWVDGTLQRVPRPQSYPCLTHRYDATPDNLCEVVPWTPQRRERHVDLTVPDQRDDGASDSMSEQMEPVFCFDVIIELFVVKALIFLLGRRYPLKWALNANDFPRILAFNSKACFVCLHRISSG